MRAVTINCEFNLPRLKVSVPAPWWALQLSLRVLGDPVISYEQCAHIASNCGIHCDNELKEALWFPHTKLGVIRRDKLYSQFIVTKFSTLHAGGRSLFRFQTIRMATCSSSRSPEPRPLIRALERVRPKPVYLLYWI